MSLRFRVSSRSAFGLRLQAVPRDQRKAFFDAVIERGLADHSSSTTQVASGVILERIESRLARVEATLSRIAQRSVESMQLADTDGEGHRDRELADQDIRQLVGTLHALAVH